MERDYFQTKLSAQWFNVYICNVVVGIQKKIAPILASSTKKVIFKVIFKVVVPTILKMKCQIKVDSIGKKWLGTYL